MNKCDISLYAILDPSRTRGRPLVDMAVSAAKGGATIIQYRDKNADTRVLIENAREISMRLKPYNVPLLINDRVDVALASGADGVHVGQSDMSPQDARQLLGGEAIIGLTLKTDEHAMAAPADMLDYVCIGGVFDTLSKDNTTSMGVDGWSHVAKRFRQIKSALPIGAIAGIDASNIQSVLGAGADGAAIISAIFMADDVEVATRTLQSIIRDAI